MKYREILRMERRHIILDLLEQSGGDMSTSLLQTALAALGYKSTLDVVEGDAHWLCEQGLVHITQEERHRVVALSRPGAEVARGLAQHPGLRKPLDNF